ncbi:CHAT domain-containing protein [uncultured Nostoc sp.]|uniref:CHAT domain-containing protein n=1 Tax=uncultured Nostoc sp. TaxID=340711 RepID=UPI0035C9C8EE
MNENRRQAYLNLIEVLLSRLSSEEPAILKANQNLIDGGLVQTMLDYAINLAIKNDIQTFERLIKIVVNLLITLRNANFESQEFTKAIKYYEQLLTICKERSYQQIEMMLLYYIRFFYRYTDDYAKAIESGHQLLAIAQIFENRLFEAETMFHLGFDYQGLRDLDSARNNYERGLAITEQIDGEAGKKLLVDILNTLGHSYNPPYDWGLGTAIDICTKSSRIALEIGYRHGEAVALTCIGKAHYSAGGESRNFPEAIRCYERAKIIFQETGDLEKEVDALYHLQDSYNFTSNYAQAIECNNKILTIAKNLNNRLLEAHTLFDLGRSYDALGQREKEKAKNYYQQSLAIANLIDNQTAHWLQVRSRQGLGGYYIVNGDLTRAETCYQESLIIAENIGEEQGQANALQALAEIYYYQGNLNRAWEYNERSLTLKERLQDQIGRGNSIGFRGSIYLLIGEYTKALESFEQSLQVMEEIQELSGKASTLTDIGLTYLYLNQIEEAESKLRQGIELWESVRESLGDHDDFRISIFEQQARTYNLLLDVLIDQEKPLPALEIAERSRARALVDLLSRKLNGQLAETTITSPTIQKIRQIAKNPTIQEIRQIAEKENSTLVEYTIIKRGNQKLESIFIWVIEPTGKITFRRSDLESLSQQQDISLAQLIINSRKSIGVRGRASLDIVYDAPEPDETQRLQQLHSLLIKPIADLLPSDPNTHVIFIPHQELFLIPFAALQDDQGRYLVEKHTILTAPSIQVLDLTQKKLKEIESRKSQAEKTSNILIVGNPVMPCVSLNIGQPAEQLKSLPGAEKEALAIGEVLNVHPLIGAQAIESTIKFKMPQADIIHLATHGLLDYRQLQNESGQSLPGALALASDGKEDGLLTADEIFDLEINASLVVLSACDTGRGEITSDGIVGLSRSFISAGTPSIIVSLWAIPDAPTADLMTEFYHQLKLNPNKAQTLRQAMLKTMKRHPLPKDWAAFTLIGETQGTVLN